MSEWILATLMVLGALFLLLAAVGILRMPDLFTRMQAATKAATLGISCMLLAVAIFFSDAGVTMRALLIVAFVFLTAPVAAHMIGRAAYLVGVPMWQGTIIDELRVHYDSAHASKSHPPSAAANPSSEPQSSSPGSKQ